MKKLLPLICGVALLLGYQNCSEVGFSNPTDAGVNKVSGGDGVKDPDDGADDDGGPNNTGEPASVECGKDNKKVLICHVPPGNPAGAQTLCVGNPAVAAHIAHHDDYAGECDADGGGNSEDVSQ